MKTLIKIMALCFVAALLHSCFKDESTLDVNTIEGVEIDTSGISNLTIYQFENLIVEPDLVTDGLAEERLSYEWKINLEPDDTVYQVLGEQRNLNSEIIFSSTEPGDFHQLVYTVTDGQTGIDYIMTWPLRILNSIGEGIVVAETPDGINTDLSHIMSPEVTPDFASTDVKHNVFSTLNGTTIPGITKQLKGYTIFGENAIIGITDEMIYKINPLDYSLAGTDGGLFYVAPESFNPQKLDAVNQGSIIVNNGELTSTFLGVSRKFGVPFTSDYDVPEVFAVNPAANPAVTLNFYSEELERFIYQPSLTQFGDRTMHLIPGDEGAEFDPANLSGKKNLAASAGTNGNFRHVLQDEASGEVGLYIFDGGQSIYPDIFPPAPIAYFDLSQAPEINEAQYFAFLDDQRILYYATTTKIYAVLFASSSLQVEERYTLPAGEEITTLQVYQQADYPFRSTDDYLPLNNDALLMSSYDNTQGKVYLLPLINTGLGNVDTSNITSYEGFSRITALGIQL
ncbi:PKD-like family lipoprotein [Salinimicrobium sp. WS361]|uniref:PKD-like family lipoprotein n=1 Tax=Salinimicrobium sp. WS361 TaxID=3425123 RepID=UPI003D6F15F3